MNKDVQTIGSNPTGLKGRLAGLIMNLIHANQYRKIIKHAIEEEEGKGSAKILDVGCGGGKAISLFSSMLKNSKIYGIDHSADMVSLAREVNKKEIENGKVDIIECDATDLPYANDYFDIIAAFDTINFWTDFNKAIVEIKRTLKANGIFLIVNGYPKEGTKWWKFVKFKSENAYRKVLLEHGFTHINVKIEKSTIIIEAQ